MAVRLILNADDFGLTPGINRAIADLHRAGVLTSATLMATGLAFEDAVATARSLPALGVGCHVVLVDGTPLSPPDEIPTLLAPTSGSARRIFRPSLAVFVRDLLLGRINPAEIAREALAQVRRLQSAGLRVTHLDTHKHTHIFPAVARALIAAAAQAGVRALRNPFEPAFARRLRHAPMPRRLQIAALGLLQPAFSRLAGSIAVPDGTIGISATGSLTPYTLHQLLGALASQAQPTGAVYELCCHPGYPDAALDQITTRLRTHRNLERKALLTEVPTTAAELIHYGDLGCPL